MLDTIIELLKNSKADDWSVTDTKTVGWEFYYIRHALDQNRAKDVEHINVNVYKKSDDGKYIGSASSEIAPTETKEKALMIINDLIYRASLVKNQMYTLHPGIVDHDAEASSDISSVAADFIRTMHELPETEGEDINSYEIFVNDIERRLITSQGTDITEKYPKSMLEVVVNARCDKHEIELYRMYHSGTCDEEGLKSDIAKTLAYGKDRLHTQPTPALGKCDVVFSTSDAKQIYAYFLNGLNATYILKGCSNMKIDEPINANIIGDKVNIHSVRTLPNSSMNFKYDAEGAPIAEKTLMENSTPKAYWGSRMYAQYLGLNDAFIVSNFTADGGTKSEEEIRSGRYLEIVEFSDFQVSSMTGDVYGEIREGYLHDGDKVTIVSGGSVSGSMRDYCADMWMSKTQTQYNEAKIPSLTRLMNVTIASSEE